MFPSLSRQSFGMALSAGAIILAAGSPALAQPANRPAAFQSAIGASLALAPGWVFYEASLENDGGQWKFEVDVVAANGMTMLEYEVDASTFAVLRSRNKSLSSSKISQIQSTLAAFGAATITYPQAIALAAGRTPFGTQMQQIEVGVESAHATYKFDFSDSLGSVQRVNVDAVTGGASTGGSSGGGGGGGSGGGGCGGGMPAPGDLTLDQAIAVANSVYPGARILETEFEASDHRWEIKLVTAQGVARKLRIASPGGAILSDDTRLRGREDSADDNLRLHSLSGAAITLAQAKALALNFAPGTTARKAGWEYEHGRLVAKVEVDDSIGPRTILVDASDGSQVIPTPDAAPAAAPAPLVDVAGATAATIAAVPGSAPISLEMELKGGRQFYKVKVLSLATPLRLREIVVDGKTGVVWSNTLLPMSAAYLPTARLIVQLLPTATRTFASANQIAVATLADGQVQSIELESQGSFLTYNVDVLVGTKMFELVIDSRTGAVRPK